MRIARCVAPAARALPCSRHRKEDITLQIEMGENLLQHSTIAEERLLTLDAMRGAAARSVFARPAPEQQNAGRLSFGGSFDAPVH
jgi:hypothetical protein